MNNFDQNLKRGLKFEQGEALALLHEKMPDFCIINNKVDPTETTGGKVVGPRMYRGKNREETFILPDFLAIKDDGVNFWFDAKLKNKSYGYGNDAYFTIDRYKHQSYCKLPQHVLSRFYLIFKDESTGNSYMGKFNIDPPTVYFNNTYGKGETPLYYLRDLTIL